MAVTDRKIDPAGKTALKCITFAIGTSATGQTALLKDAVTPGFAFKVVSVEAMATAVTAVISFDVQIGTTSVLASAITPVANVPTAGTLSATTANLIGSKTGILKLKYTSDGSGAVTDGRVRVWIRPQPLNGENAQ